MYKTEMSLPVFSVISIAAILLSVFLITTSDIPINLCPTSSETQAYPSYLMCWAPSENQTDTDYVIESLNDSKMFDWYISK